LTAFERLFRERGLPLPIRFDNDVPFASPNALFNLSKLPVWWLRLERIKPGHPQQNGRHERVHLTLRKEATCNKRSRLLFVVGHCAHILKSFASARFCVATLRADVASTQPLTVASYG
jgi:hypothetical protein